MTFKGLVDTMARLLEWLGLRKRPRKPHPHDTPPVEGRTGGLRLFRVLGLVLVCTVVLSCDTTEPGELVLVNLIGPNDSLGTASYRVMATRILPPAEYRVWYNDAASCAGLPGRFARVEWYLVPLPWKGPRGSTVYGQHGPGPRIVLNALTAGEPYGVKHESMHDILELNDRVRQSVTHDTTYFNTRCLGG